MFDLYEFGNIYNDAHLAKLHQSEENTKTLCDWSKEPKNILFFCGNVGTGKTYFCAAWYNALRETRKNVRAYSEQHFFRELKQMIQLDWDPLYRIKIICDAEYVILDDLGSSKMTEWQKEMLSEFLDLRFASGLPTLITSNLDSKGIREQFTPRFHSRLFSEKNTIVEQNGSDRRNPS